MWVLFFSLLKILNFIMLSPCEFNYLFQEIFILCCEQLSLKNESGLTRYLFITICSWSVEKLELSDLRLIGGRRKEINLKSTVPARGYIVKFIYFDFSGKLPFFLSTHRFQIYLVSLPSLFASVADSPFLSYFVILSHNYGLIVFSGSNLTVKIIFKRRSLFFHHEILL